jgi:hypothetical protein
MSGCCTGVVAADGPTQNLRLTSLTGVVLLVLLAVEGFTLISLRSLLSVHIFVGVLVVPIVLLKLGSTGYRFLRYYTHRADYVRAGPPSLPLRLLGPIVVLATLALLGTGLALIAVGPGSGSVLLLHKASFVVWLGALGLHVLGHLKRVQRALSSELNDRSDRGRARLRLLLVASAVVAGAVTAVALLPASAPWLHWVGFDH